MSQSSLLIAAALHVRRAFPGCYTDCLGVWDQPDKLHEEGRNCQLEGTAEDGVSMRDAGVVIIAFCPVLSGLK